MTSTYHNLRVATAPTPPRIRTRGRSATLIVCGTLTMMAGATIAPAIPSIQAAFAGTPDVELWARMLITTPALAIALYGPLAGLMADRVGRKPTLIAGIVAFGLGGTSGAYLPSLPLIIIGRAVLGVGVSMIMTASVAMIGDLYGGADRQRLLGRQAAATAFGGVAFLLGGGFLAGVDWRIVFLVYLLGAAMLVPALVFLPYVRPDRDAVNYAASVVNIRGPRAVPSSARVRVGAPLLAAMLAQVAFYAVPVQIPFVVQGTFHGSALATGAVIAIMTFTVGMVAMRFGVIRQWASEHVLVGGAFLAIGFGCVIVFMSAGIPGIVIGLVAMACGLGVLVPCLANWVVTAAPPHSRGRYVSLLTSAMFLGQFVSPLVTQPIVDHVGIQRMFALLGLAAVPVATVYFLLARRADPVRKLVTVSSR
jgi:MFS family permease